MRSSLKLFAASALAGLALLLAASFFARAQAPAPRPAQAPAAAPSADQILDRYLSAIGGRAAWEKLNSRTSLGRIDIPSMHLSGTVMIHDKAPNRSLLVVILAGATFRQGYDGIAGWTDDPQDGLRDITGAQLTETARDADFYHPLHLKKLYSKFATAGVEEINGHNCYALEATLPDGSVDKLYFDAASGLLLRLVGQRHDDTSATKVQEDFDDYKEVEGVKLPFTLQQVDEKAPFTIHIDELHHNVDLDDSEFAKPAAR